VRGKSRDFRKKYTELLLDFQIRQLQPKDSQRLLKFLNDLAELGEDRFFHPHPAEIKVCSSICEKPGLDYFCGGFQEDQMVVYGMLRGWNEGFCDPSLGLAVHPARRSLGLARAMLVHLMGIAEQKKCLRIRLTVYRQNERAFRFFTSAGFQFTPSAEIRMEGWLRVSLGKVTPAT